MSARIPSLGILGGGQLASMITTAANRLGVDVHVYRAAESRDRCSADQLTTASYDDEDALRAFAETVDVVTIETEDIPVQTLRVLEDLVAVRPSADVVEIVQDRLLEKQFLTDAGVATTRFAAIDSAHDLGEQLPLYADGAILKTRRFGYDGKGQTRVQKTDDAVEAWQQHGGAPSILEAMVPFDFELSVIAARSESDDVAMYDPGRNTHRDGILHRTDIPAGIDPGLEQQAFDIAKRILDAFSYVGVMGIEFFVVGSTLLVNELAPRVHNSGHWTQEGCVVDQFQQHVRAVMGYPLGATARHCDVVMTNLLGDDVDDPALRERAGSRLHLYGKRDARPGRKMGHVNTVRPLGSAPSDEPRH